VRAGGFHEGFPVGGILFHVPIVYIDPLEKHQQSSGEGEVGNVILSHTQENLQERPFRL
jgi:hypothetical protein